MGFSVMSSRVTEAGPGVHRVQRGLVLDQGSLTAPTIITAIAAAPGGWHQQPEEPHAPSEWQEPLDRSCFDAKLLDEERGEKCEGSADEQSDL